MSRLVGWYCRFIPTFSSRYTVLAVITPKSSPVKVGGPTKVKMLSKTEKTGCDRNLCCSVKIFSSLYSADRCLWSRSQSCVTARRGLYFKNIYARMLFVDYSSAFNTITPTRLFTKLQNLKLHPTLCHWIFDFLSEHRQVVKMGSITSARDPLHWNSPGVCPKPPPVLPVHS